MLQYTPEIATIGQWYKYIGPEDFAKDWIYVLVRVELEKQGCRAGLFNLVTGSTWSYGVDMKTEQRTLDEEQWKRVMGGTPTDKLLPIKRTIREC